MVTFTNSITAGETFSADVTESGATSITVKLRGPEVLDLEATEDGGAWSVTADTSAWKAGLYEVTVWAEVGGAVKIIHRARLTVKALASEAHDPRSSAEKIVAAIDSYLAAPGQDVTWASYKINNREMQRYSIADLIALRSHYALIAKRERNGGVSPLGPRISVFI